MQVTQSNTTNIFQPVAGYQTTTSEYPSSNGSSSKASWKKFSTETTTQYSQIHDLNQAFDEENYEEVLRQVDQFLEKDLPFLHDSIRGLALLLKSVCYEQLNQFDAALKNLKKAKELFKKHNGTLQDEFQAFFDIDVKTLLQLVKLQKAGIRLLQGEEEKALKTFKENQPTHPCTILLYRLMEEKSQTTLLDPKTLELLYFTDHPLEAKAVRLALDGKIDEAIALLEDEEGITYNVLCAIKYREWEMAELLSDDYSLRFPISSVLTWLIKS